jgi:hypothetical protein
MLNFQVLNAIENKIKYDEQRFVIRAVIQNRLVRDELNSSNEQAISNFFPENQLNFWNPAAISFLGKGINLEWMENLKTNFASTIDEELFSRAFKTYERILNEKEFQPNLEDAFLVSLVLHNHFIRSGSWKEISKKIPFGLNKLNTSEKEFWSAVFGCLINTLPNYIEPLVQLLIENPYQNSVELTTNSLLMTPHSDEELKHIFVEILSTLKVETIIRFLLILNFSGATQIAQQVAIAINNKIPPVNNLQDIIDKSTDHFDWINAQELALVVQQIGLLKSFAGDTQKASVFFDKSNQILLDQIQGLNKLKSDIQIYSRDETNNNESQIDVQSTSGTLNKLNHEDKIVINANEKNGWPIYKIDWNPIKDLELLIKDDRIKEAFDFLEKIKENRKNDPEYYRLSSEINLSLGDINTAFENCLIAYALKPNDIKIQKLMAILHYQKGLWEKSFNYLNNIYMRGAEFSIDEISHLVQAAIKTKQTDYALKVCNSYGNIKGENSLIDLLLAKIALSKSDFTDAYKFLQKSIELDKYNSEAWIFLSILENIKKDPEKSLDALITGYKYIPDSLEICIALAEKFLEMGNKLNGFSYLKEACLKSITSLNTSLNLINLLEKYRLFPEIENAIKVAGEKWKKNINIAKSKAKYLLEVERFDDAKEVLNPYLIDKKIEKRD